MDVTIYTDGACAGNPGPGGWGAVLLIGNDKKEIFGGEESTTNNRMELTATIKAIEYFDDQKKMKIFTDSTYVKDGITTWIKKWEKNDWKTSDKKKVKNIDLWIKLNNLTKLHKIEWAWIKGHSKNPMNDLADKLAKKATPI